MWGESGRDTPCAPPGLLPAPGPSSGPRGDDQGRYVTGATASGGRVPCA